MELYDLRDGHSLRSLTGHTGWILAAAAVPLPGGTTLLATAGDDGTVRFWNLSSAPPESAEVVDDDQNFAALAADGQRYRATGDVTDLVWWAIGTDRFEAGELDDLGLGIRQLRPDESLWSTPTLVHAVEAP